MWTDWTDCTDWVIEQMLDRLDRLQHVETDSWTVYGKGDLLDRLQHVETDWTDCSMCSRIDRLGHGRPKLRARCGVGAAPRGCGAAAEWRAARRHFQQSLSRCQSCAWTDRMPIGPSPGQCRSASPHAPSPLLPPSPAFPSHPIPHLSDPFLDFLPSPHIPPFPSHVSVHLATLVRSSICRSLPDPVSVEPVSVDGMAEPHSCI